MSFEWKFYNLETGRHENPVEIIRKKKLICAFCKGQGNIDGGLCPICSGQGKNQVFPPLIRCRRCSGWGSYPMNSQSSCTVCRGRGAVSVKLPIVFCMSCQGRGDSLSGLFCTKCRGQGVVTGDERSKKEMERKVATGGIRFYLKK